MYRPFRPHVRNGEGESRPPSRRLTRGVFGDIEA
jgi:hypothetical protein